MKKIIIVMLFVPILCGFSLGDIGDIVKGAAEKIGIDTSLYDNLPAEYRASIEGAMAGAGIGALIGKVKGYDNKKTMRYALYGSAIGGLATGAYTKAQVERSKELEKESADLDKQITIAQEAVNDAKNYNKNLEIEIEKTRQEREKAKSDYQNKKITEEQLRQKNEKAKELTETAKANCIIMEAQAREIKLYRDKHENENSRKISEMNKKIEELEHERDIAEAGAIKCSELEKNWS